LGPVDRKYTTEAERIEAEVDVEESSKRAEQITFDFKF